MADLYSPGVQVKEIDLTNVVPSVSSTIGAMAGAFQWGPCEEITTVTSETELVDQFGKPNADTFESVLSAAQFLSYGNALKVVRAVGTSARNATASGTGILAKNDSHFDTLTIAAGDWVMARHPGVIGTALTVEVATDPSSWTANASWKLWTDSAPGTSAGAAAVGGSNDEIHIVVRDFTGAITGTAGSVLESFQHLSQANDVKAEDGTTLYYKDHINARSKWIRIGNHSAASGKALTDAGESAAGNAFTRVNVFFSNLSGGVDDNALTLGETTAMYNKFADAETVDLSLVFQANSGLSNTETRTLSNYITALCAARKDAVGFVSPERAATVGVAVPLTPVAAWRTNLTSTSYGFADSSSLYVYDKYNDVYRWICAAGSMAGLAANADLTADAWFSPAGFTRGNVRNVTKLAWNPNQADRDELYRTGVNPIVTFPGQGTVLFGDKTIQSKASAFDRINVRRLFIVLEKAVSTASKASLFEFNDEFTRAQFRNMVEPFLRDVQGRRGITDFKVVCDGTNNTGNIIDSNKFVADIYVKPARSINFITLNFIATRTGVEFSEIAGGN
jgi:phage tail sheath protein FI